MSHLKETYPVDTGRKLKVHKTFIRRPERLLNFLCTFNYLERLTSHKIRILSFIYLIFQDLKLSLLQNLRLIPCDFWKTICGTDMHSFVLHICFLHASLIERASYSTFPKDCEIEFDFKTSRFMVSRVMFFCGISPGFPSRLAQFPSSMKGRLTLEILPFHI